jgi:hypothetical protein
MRYIHCNIITRMSSVIEVMETPGIQTGQTSQIFYVLLAVVF